jgi:hypothetical protein
MPSGPRPVRCPSMWNPTLAQLPSRLLALSGAASPAAFGCHIFASGRIARYRPAPRPIELDLFLRWRNTNIESRGSVSLQHPVLGGSANRARFGFQGNLCSTACTKSSHVIPSP